MLEDVGPADVGTLMLGAWLLLEGEEWVYLTDRKLFKTGLLVGGGALVASGFREPVKEIENVVSDSLDQVDELLDWLI